MALSRELYELCGFVYVDDCDLVATGDTILETAENLQEILTHWDGYMQVTGAALAPDKCWWYLIDFSWKGGTWSYRDRNDVLQLNARDKSGTLTNLEFCSHAEAKKMVGVHLAPIGTEKAQLKALQAQVDIWTLHMLEHSVDAVSAWIALSTTISKSLEYPLVATCISESQLNRVYSSLLCTALPKANFVRSLPRAVVFGPISHQGLGLPHPYIFQMVKHIQEIVNQLWRTKEAPSLLRSNLEVMQLEAGTSDNLFGGNAFEITWFNTTNSWIIQTLQFCRKHKIVLDIPFLKLLPQCQKDKFIMEELATAGFSKQSLIRLNRCRLYYHVVTLSDITTGQGTSLRPYLAEKIATFQSNRYIWPNQGSPTKADLVFWKQSLRQVFSGNGLMLKDKLGDWEIQNTEEDQWVWYISQTGDLVRRHNNVWSKFPPTASRNLRHTRFHNVPQLMEDLNLTDLHRTTVSLSGRMYIATGTRPTTLFQDREHLSIIDKIRVSPKTKWCTTHFKLVGNLQDLIDALWQGKGTCISDGSYIETVSLCTMGWIIYISDGLIMEGGGCVPGCIVDESAYRGELGGLLAIFAIITTLEEYSPPPSTFRLRVGCDSDSALGRALHSDREYMNSTWKSFDMISALVSFRESSNASPKLVQVKGHADDFDRELTHDEKLNVRVDEIADDITQLYLRESRDRLNDLPPQLRGSIGVYIGDIWVGSTLPTTLRQQIGKRKILQWWVHKKRLSLSAIKSVHWDVVNRTFQESSYLWRKFMIKWITSTLPTGQNMTRRQHRFHSLCPLCITTVETHLHLIQCPAPTASATWEAGLASLALWLTQEDTQPQLRRAIIRILSLCRRHGWSSPWILYDVSPTITRCLVAQSQIGWQQFLTGLLAKQWAQIQQTHYTARTSRRSGRRWAIRLSNQLWKLLFSVWENRNTILHETQINNLSGLSCLKWAIGQEYQIGLLQLPALYHHYLQMPAQPLLSGPIPAMKQWLVLIRHARCQAGAQYTDQIENSQALRRWIGL